MKMKSRKADAKASTSKATDAWVEKPALIRQFVEQRPDYERLCDEVQYILKKRLTQRGVEISTVSSRAKTLNSFLEKIQRKSYANPLREMSDVAGVRVVHLYIRDIKLIEKIIKEEFDLIEKVDKFTDKKPNQFGYGAIHFVVRLRKEISGARYEDIKRLKCEIQVRTVLQDAWAIIDHHLVYKTESAVPTSLQRKLNGLAGLFETADDQFEQIRKQRKEYVAEMRESSVSENSFLGHEVNADSLLEYLKWKFPGVPVEKWEGQFKIAQEKVDFLKYRTLKQIDGIMDQTKHSRKKLEHELPNINRLGDKVPSCIELALALSLTDNDYWREVALPTDWRPVIQSRRKFTLA
jgi:ppGpp synthetase/RelA/SpoT-type nucleotidyltranferase